MPSHHADDFFVVDTIRQETAMTQFSLEPVRVEHRGRHVHFFTRFRVSVDPETAQRRLVEYFERLGFVRVAEAPALTMQRGAFLRSALRWEPRTLPVRLQAQLQPDGEQTEVALTLDLNRTGHVIVGAEIETLRAELQQAAQFTATGEANFARLELLNQRTRERANLAIGLGVAVALPVFISLFLFVRPLLTELGITGATRGWLLGALGGAVFGAAAWLFARHMLRSASE